MWRPLPVLPVTYLIVCSATSQAETARTSRNLTISDVTVKSAQVDDGLATEPIGVSTDESALPAVPSVSSNNLPKRPRSAGVIVKNATAIDMQWQPPSPKDHDGTIRGYLICIQPVDEWNEPIGDKHKYNITDGTATHYTVTNLEPDTNYAVHVGAYTRLVDGELTRPIMVKTFPVLPLAPKLEEPELSEEQGRVQVKLQWKRPEQMHGPLRGYRVMYRNRDSLGAQFIVKKMLPGNEFISIRDLGLGMSYEFRIAALNSLGVGMEAVKVVWMPEGVPTGPPQNISYWFYSPSSVRVVWRWPMPDMQNGLITGFSVYVEFNGTIVKSKVRDVYFDFAKMQPREQYAFRVSAWTQKGEGKVSSNIIITTLTEVPPQPDMVYVAAINDTHAEVRWALIQDTPFMQVQGYKVSFRCVEEINLNNLCTHAGSVDVDWFSESYGQSSVILPNMEAGKNYSVTVAAKTQQSMGPPSNQAVFRMAPEEVPWDIHAINIAKYSIILRWKPPLVVVPIRYHVAWSGRKEFLDQHGTMQIIKMPRSDHATSTTETTLRYLEPHTTYSISLTAVLQGGFDAPTVWLDVKTAADAPPLLLPPAFITVTTNETISIQLKRATEEYGPIKHYLLVVVPRQLANKHLDNYNLAKLTGHHELSSGQQTENGNSGFPYIAAQFSRDNLPPTFDLGDGNVYGLYQNRALKPGQHYKVFVRAYVDSPNNLEPLYTSSPFSEDISTDRQANPGTSQAAQKDNTSNAPT